MMRTRLVCCLFPWCVCALLICLLAWSNIDSVAHTSREESRALSSPLPAMSYASIGPLPGRALAQSL